MQCPLYVALPPGCCFRKAVVRQRLVELCQQKQVRSTQSGNTCVLSDQVLATWQSRVRWLTCLYSSTPAPHASKLVLSAVLRHGGDQVQALPCVSMAPHRILVRSI